MGKEETSENHSVQRAGESSLDKRASAGGDLVAAYGLKEPNWAEKVDPRKFFLGKEDVAFYLEDTDKESLGNLRFRLAVSFSVVAVLVLLFSLRDWKLKDWLLQPGPEGGKIVLEISRIDPDRFPVAFRNDVTKINGFLDEKNYLSAHELIAGLVERPDFPGDYPEDKDLKQWLVDTTVRLAWQVGEKFKGRPRGIEYFKKARSSYEKLTSEEFPSGYDADYAFCAVLFSLTGGWEDAIVPLPVSEEPDKDSQTRKDLENVLDSLGTLRSRHGAALEMEDDDKKWHHLAWEGYTLARLLYEHKAGWFSGRFDPENLQNQNRWNRLDALVGGTKLGEDEMGKAAGSQNSVYRKLRCFFLSTIRSFTHRIILDETVKIGDGEYKESWAEEERDALNKRG